MVVLLSDGHERAERALRPQIVLSGQQSSMSFFLGMEILRMHLFLAAFWLLLLFSINLLQFLILLAHFFSLISFSLLHILFHLT